MNFIDMIPRMQLYSPLFISCYRAAWISSYILLLASCQVYGLHIFGKLLEKMEWKISLFWCKQFWNLIVVFDTLTFPWLFKELLYFPLMCGLSFISSDRSLCYAVSLGSMHIPVVLFCGFCLFFWRLSQENTIQCPVEWHGAFLLYFLGIVLKFQFIYLSLLSILTWFLYKKPISCWMWISSCPNALQLRRKLTFLL